MSFTEAQLKQLAERAESSPRVAKELASYVRHVTRIHTLLRVLDPADVNAVGNTATGNPTTYQAEIDRRQAELVKVEAFLQTVLERTVAPEV